jgi:hypothetical protein
LAEATFVGVIDGGRDGEVLLIILDRVGVGEASLVMAVVVRRFGVRGAGDTISTNTRGSWGTLVETFSDIFLLVALLLGKKDSSSSD